MTNPFIKNWTIGILTGSLALTFSAWYIFYTFPDISLMRLINRATAEAGVMMICLSMAMSGIVYFWDFADHYLLYRKHWGLVGFYLVLYHGLYSLYRFALPLETSLSRAFSWPPFELTGLDLQAFIYAFISILILIFMGIISNNWATKLLGGRTWRRLLRTGYLAILLGGLHSGLKSFDDWQAWLTHLDPVLPPLSLLTTLLIIFTLILRLSLQISLWRKPANNSG